MADILVRPLVSLSAIAVKEGCQCAPDHERRRQCHAEIKRRAANIRSGAARWVHAELDEIERLLAML